MRINSFSSSPGIIALAGAAMALAACSSGPSGESYPGVQDNNVYADPAASASPIPPSARARRAASPHPNSQGVSPRVRAEVRDQQRAYSGPSEGYYASPRAREQIADELAEEYSRREQAYGPQQRGEPRPIDLGPGPGLSRISPQAQYGTSTDTYGGASYRGSPVYAEPEDDYEADYASQGPRLPGVPADAPPLPDSARPGDCYVLIKHPARYRNVSERRTRSAERSHWRTRGAPMQRLPNSTGDSACLVREPARYETVNRRERISDARYEWREVVCEASLDSQLIRDLQRALQRAGYPPGPIDGIFGPRTRSAVNAYQRDNGLPVDDRLNVTTLRDLGLYR